MPAAKLTLKQARRLAVQCQLLDSTANLPKNKEGAARVIERLGYVQVDTINVIERAHHHTLWTRLPDYQPEMLLELQAKDRRVFEYWGHAASYLPMTDYRFYRPQMKSYLKVDPVSSKYDTEDWKTKWIKENRKLLNMVLTRVRKQGPLTAADFPDVKERRRDSWWDWKPAKTALEILFWTGKLMITERRRFQRVFDLTERVLPPGVNTKMPARAELGRFAVRRALNAHGIATAREIKQHIALCNQKTIDHALAELIDAGKVVPVETTGLSDRDYYAWTENLEFVSRRKPRLRLLSPFDNLIIQRDRTRALFGFDYQLECYKVPKQRKYGYFVLPILWGTELIARLDPKADRKAKKLVVRSLVFEPGFTDYDAVLQPLARKLHDFAAFNEVGTVVLERIRPAKLKAPLNRLLRV